MINLENVGRVQEYTPTIVEVFYWGVLASAGIIIILNPDSLLFMGGIEDNFLANQPVWIGFVLVIASPFWLFITKFQRWARD